MYLLSIQIQTWIFKSLNFEINQNDCIAIVGPSGSGKTTLIDLFLGLLKPTSGEILINGKKSEDKNVLFNLSAYLPQDSLVIEDTIKRNISLETDEDKIDVDLINKSIKSLIWINLFIIFQIKLIQKLEKMDLDYLVVKNRVGYC